MIVYCKKDYHNTNILVYDILEYHKYKIYQSTDIIDGRVYVYSDIKKYEGIWFSMETFDKYFTTDKNFVRQEKIKRICGEESIL